MRLTMPSNMQPIKYFIDRDSSVIVDDEDNEYESEEDALQAGSSL